MSSLTEEEFNSLPAESNGQMSEDEFNALSSEPVAPVKTNESTIDSFNRHFNNVAKLGKNIVLGASNRFENQAAGLADLVGMAPQSWLNKIANQNEWSKQNEGSGIGSMLADATTGIATNLALPEVKVAGAILNPLARVGSDILQGGAQGFALNPGDIQDRVWHGAGDAAGAGLASGAGQLVKPLVKTVSGLGRSIHDMFTETGHISKLADYVKQAVPEVDIANVIDNLGNYKKLVPNYQPTAAEAGQHFGLNTLHDYASGTNPGQYVSRELQNIGAESDLLKAIADTSNTTKKIAIRDGITNPLYEAAKQTFVPVNKDLVKLFKRPEMRSALVKAMETASNAGNPSSIAMLRDVLSGRNNPMISGDALHHVKLGIDSLITIAKDPRAGLDQRAYNNIRKAFEDWRVNNIPEYAKAQSMYQKLSGPVNRRTAGEAIVNKVYPHGTSDVAALDATNPFVLGDILRDPNKLIKKGTGFSGSTLENTFTKRQQNLLSNLSENQRRRAASELTSGTGFHHDTSGNMAARGAGAVVQAATGIPGIYQGSTAKLLADMTGQNKAMQSSLGDILLSPEETAKLFKVGKRNPPADFMDSNVLNRIPGLVGYLSSNQLMNQ